MSSENSSMNIRKAFVLSGFLYLSIQILITSCAQVSSPTGGPKDTIPPRIVTVNPPPGALRFNEKSIQLEFNEAIQIKDIQNQLIITPSIEGKYTPKLSKNTLELVFEEEFSENTTYTLAFREAIGDLNEGNAAEDLKLAFSTGDYLDSLSINGRIRNMFTGKAVEDALVSLYLANDTSNLFNSRPYYLAKTNEEGYYQFDNLKDGQYLIYATKDANNNLKADSRSEPFGFIKDTISLNENIDSLNIKIQSLNTEPLMINNSRPSGHNYVINLNKGIRSYELKPLEPMDEILYSNMAEQNKSLQVYKTFPIQDSLAAHFTAIDSLGQERSDTLYIRFEESSRAKEPFTTTITPKTGTAIQENFNASIKFNKPVTTVNLDSLYFQYDSLTHVQIDTAKNFTWNTQRDELNINIQLDASQAAAISTAAAEAQAATTEEGENEPNEPEAEQEAPNNGVQRRPAAGSNNNIPKNGVLLYAGKGAFISVENDSSDNQQLKYTFAEPKNFGLVEGRFQSSEENFTIQLVQAANFSMVKESSNQHNFRFNFVPPGEYLIRIFIDENGNGQWDPGNVHQRIEPEPVIISQEKIILKANWEIRDILISE